MKVPALLKNKYVCYALMALAALNVIGYVTVKSWECLALFALAGYSAHCYCKNVSLAILASLFVANFVFGCGRVKEGMEDMMKGPAEHMATAAAEAMTGATKCDDHQTQAVCADIAATATAAAKECEWKDNKCQEAAAAATFTADAGTCCDGSAMKAVGGDFTQANLDACSAASPAIQCQ